MAFKPLLHLWSLAVEEQFYLVWPLLLWLCHRGRWPVQRMLAGLGLVSLILGLLILKASGAAAFYLPVGRVVEFVLGAIVATRPSQATRSAWRQQAMAWTGVAALVLSLLLLDGERAFPGLWVLLPTAGTALLIASGPQGWFHTRVLAARPLVWAGLISYPLYLWHWPLLAFAALIQGGMPPRGARVLAVVLAVILAWLTWRWIELPIRRRRDVHAPTLWRSDVFRLVLALCGLGVTGALIQARDGLPERIPQLADIDPHRPIGLEQAVPPLRPCPNGSPATLRCLDDGRWPKVVIIGDSHGQALVAGLQHTMAAAGLHASLSYQYKMYCMPLRDVETHDQLQRSMHCMADYNAVYDWAARDPDVKAIILAGRWAARASSGDGSSGAEGGLIGRNGYTYQVSGHTLHDTETIFVKALGATLQTLAQAHKPMLLVHSVPEFQFNPPFCRTRPVPLWRWQAPADRCTTARSEVDRRQHLYRQRVAQVTAGLPSLMFTDPMDVLCDAVTCAMWRPQTGYLYHDDDHLNEAGARLVAVDIVRQLGQLPALRQAYAP
jgi:hypothetical protein